jgi:D-alanyl-lipoteichoic acid acyltransferase DltB (MBOAT superfamily)
MVFSSVTFLFWFLPLFMATYWFTPSLMGKNLVVVGFSMVFYGWGEPWFVAVLVGTIILNVAAALIIDACEGVWRKAALAAAVAANLGLLGFFKYANFVSDNLSMLLHPLGINSPSLTIALPLGISFFTFHSLSYIIDVYRKRFVAERNPLIVALYITMFPQLVAGPIVRYRSIARQLRKRWHTLGRASVGTRMFVIGLAQKVLLADQIGQLADKIFDHPENHSLIESWIGLLAYTLQIYFDFAGYSNMAIGLGLCLGFAFPRNFRMPYTSLSITEFWRRWHISLSSWFRDYLYIPLGGSRGSRLQTYRNLITVFLLCGLWHGASWTFLLWGAWHGLFLVLERVGLGQRLERLPPLARWFYTIFVVMGGWALFRSSDLSMALQFYRGLFGLNGIGGLSFEAHAALQPTVIVTLIAASILSVVPYRPRWPSMVQRLQPIADTAWMFSLFVLTAIFASASTYTPFLYFRF